MNEFDAIEALFKPLSRNHPGALSLKDDVAFVDGLVITTDTIVENIHFRAQDDISTIAQKLVRVNVSDIICKGSVPRFAFLNLTWPVGRKFEDLNRFSDGLNSALSEFELNLIGGDTTKTNGPLVLSMTMVGTPINDLPIQRHKAKIGDRIFVSGNIGSARLGLMALEHGLLGFENCIKHYQIPQIPNLRIGNLISCFATSSLDVSDGLIGDSKKLCPEALEPKINLELLPFNAEVKSWINGQSDFAKAACDLARFGDDYQCVFTIAPTHTEPMLQMANENNIDVTMIGEVTKKGQGGLKFGDETIALPDVTSYSHDF